MKERSRFDALAEELSSEEPKSEKTVKSELERLDRMLERDRKQQLNRLNAGETKFPAPSTTVQAKRDGIREQPNAFISVMGRSYTVIEWRVDTTIGSDAFGTKAQFATSLDIRLKLPGAVPSADLLQDQSACLIIKWPGIDEMQYIRLEVRDVSVSMTSTDRYTTVSAYGTRVMP